MNGTLRGIRSILKIIWIVLRQMALIAWALVRLDVAGAAGHTRVLAMAVHNDMLWGIAAFQRAVPLWRVPGPDLGRILIIKLDRIGDMVTTTPVFDALVKLFPKARLDIVAHPAPLKLLEADDRIGDRIAYRSWLYHPMPWCMPGVRAFFLMIKLLWRRYPLVVYLRGSSPFLILGLTSRLAATKFIPGEPVITRYMKALETVFGPLERPRARLRVDADAARSVTKLFVHENGFCGPRVTVHATASSETKIWPADRFAAVADALYTDVGAQVHFLATPEDQAVLKEIDGRAAHRHHFHVGFGLPQVVAAIAASDLFIGNDSGLAHIAAAVDTPIVVLWGSANLTMAQPEAPLDRCRILYHDIPCRAICPEFRCVNPTHVECMDRVQVADVVAAARELLSGRPVVSRSAGPAESVDSPAPCLDRHATC